MTEAIAARPIEPFGALVDFDVRGIDDSHRDELRHLFSEHYVLVFRNQGALARATQSRLMAMIGPLTPDDDDLAVVSNDPDEGALGSAPLAFHSDHEYCPEPALGISLHAIDVAEAGSCTRFASGVHADQRLNEVERKTITDLSALHVLATDTSRRNDDEDCDPRWPQAVHPLVLQHPTSGAPVLYATEMQTTRIRELPRSESDDRLHSLFSALYADEHVLEHDWRSGDLVIWDNVALQHGRPATGEARRTLQRVSIGSGLTSQFPNLKAHFPGKFSRLGGTMSSG